MKQKKKLVDQRERSREVPPHQQTVCLPYRISESESTARDGRRGRAPTTPDCILKSIQTRHDTSSSLHLRHSPPPLTFLPPLHLLVWIFQ